LKRAALWSAVLAAAVFAGIQFVPTARTNPPVENTVDWDSPRTRELFYRTCADCHSHETHWPWYSRVAPVSWLVANHVRDGRLEMNISVPDEVDPSDAAREIRKGEMPPADYRLMHPEARLTDAEKDELIAGLKKTF
jgi:mono/diheme cytochrome c family protein